MKHEKFCFNKRTGVIALVGIVIVLAALLMGSLSQKSTSTNTRAAAPKNVRALSESDGDAWCRSTTPLRLFDGDGYKGESDTCAPAICSNSDPEVSCSNGTGMLATKGKCCRDTNYLWRNNNWVYEPQAPKVGDARCKRQNYGNFTARCVSSSECANSKTEVKLSGDCAYTTSTSGLQRGVCCGITNPPTSTPAPTATPTPLKLDATNCGINNINCRASFNNDPNIECLNNGGMSATNAWCGYKVPSTLKQCPGSKMAYPVIGIGNRRFYKPTFCLKEIIEPPTLGQGTTDYFCSITLTSPVNTTKNDSQGVPMETSDSERITDCKNLQAPRGHASDMTAQ